MCRQRRSEEDDICVMTARTVERMANAGERMRGKYGTKKRERMFLSSCRGWSACEKGNVKAKVDGRANGPEVRDLIPRLSFARLL